METKFINFTNHSYHRNGGYLAGGVTLLNVSKIVSIAEIHTSFFSESKKGEDYLRIITDEPLYKNMDEEMVHPEYIALVDGIRFGSIDDLMAPCKTDHS